MHAKSCRPAEGGMEGETVGRKQRRGREFWFFLSHCVALSEINEKLTFVIAV